MSFRFALFLTPLAFVAATELSAQNKIYIDPGHGGSDPGAVNSTFGTEEADRVLYTGLELRDYFAADTADTAGGGTWETRLSRTTDTSVSLTYRSDDANAWGADLFVSIHQNAFNSSANGTETFSYTSGSANSNRLRDLIQEEAIEAWGLVNRGSKTANFSVLRRTVMPAALTEMGFVDSPTDHPFCSSDAQCSLYAKHMLFAFQRYYSIPEYEPDGGGGGGGGGPELIVDNDDASGYAETGAWSTSGFGSFYADSARFATAAEANTTATWTPDFEEAGQYEVAAWWTDGGNRSDAAVYRIVDAEGSAEVTVNQEASGGVWNTLGTYNFRAGTEGRVVLDSAASSDQGDPLTVVIADAVRFRKVGEFFDGVIVDNDDASGYEETGSWGTSSNAGFYGSTSRFATAAVPGNVATWTPVFAEPGQFEVSAWWVAGTNRSSAASFQVIHAEGTSQVALNQEIGGEQWNLIGTYNFRAGDGGRVRLDTALAVSDGEGTVVSADAIRFERVGDYTPPADVDSMWVLY